MIHRTSLLNHNPSCSSRHPSSHAVPLLSDPRLRCTAQVIVRACSRTAVSGGRSRSRKRQLANRLVRIAEQILTPLSRRDINLDAEFSDAADLLDPVVIQYGAILEKEDLSAVHMSTVLVMSVKVAQQSGSVERLLLHHSPFLSQLLRRLSVRDLDARRLSAVVDALGKLSPAVKGITLEENKTVGDLLEDAVGLCLKRLDRFTAQEMSRTMTAFANLDCLSASRLVPLLTSLFRSRRNEFKSAELCSIAYALGSLNVPNAQSLMESLCGTVRQRLPSTTPLELTQLVWACGRLRVRIPPLVMSAVMLKIEANIRVLRPEDVTKVLWALSGISFRPRFEFLDMVEVYFTSQISSFKPSEITTVLHALAVLSYSPQTLLEVSKAFFLDHRDRFNLADYCGVVWSLSLLDALDLQFLQMAVDKIKAVNKKPFKNADGSFYVHPVIQDEDLQRLYHCLLHWQILKKEDVHHLFSGGLREVCRLSWKCFHETAPINYITSHVLHNFEYMGYVVRSPYFDPETGWVLNCVTNEGGVDIAVEIVSEEKCFVNEMHRLRGPEKWRHKILKECDWPLLIIFEDVWMTMDFQGQADFLADNVLPLIN